MKPKQRGMTLIELMIVVVVLAILASIATSSYRRQMIRANRTEATAALLRVRTAQEKYYLQHNEYATDLDDLGVPATTQRGFYTLALDPDSDPNELRSLRRRRVDKVTTRPARPSRSTKEARERRLRTTAGNRL
jgi:prepilin-type N-terminal cleavage/methylation domain-containing protein